MNEQPHNRPERGERPRQSATLEALQLSTNDPVVIERWEEGITRWGNTFIAYTRLKAPELFTRHVLSHFSDNFLSSHDTIDDFIDQQVRNFSWKRDLEAFLKQSQIPPQVLHWDFDALEVLLRNMFSVVNEGGRIYVFA